MSDSELPGYQTVGSNGPKPMPSCLRNGSSSSSSSLGKHRVTFPDDDKELVTAYLEPASPWDSAPVTPEDLITLYVESCAKHETIPLESIVEQLKTCYLPHPTLEVSGAVTLATLEALEPVLRRVRFQKLRIKCVELSDDAAVALFDMLEYYESAHTLSLTCENGLDLRSWQACSRMLKKAHGLAELDVQGTPLDEQIMPVLCRSLKVGSKLTSLQLARCGTSDRALVMLVNALKLNSQLQELTVADNDLLASDAMQLGTIFKENTTLRYLDVSNNAIGDLGCANLCDALVEQSGEGLEALVMWNTGMTAAAATHIANVLNSSAPLETLNIGQNQIGSEGLKTLRRSMLDNKKLKQLGMQAAQVNCDGAEILAEVIRNNPTLQRVDARSNMIGIRGLDALQSALDAGATLRRLDLDDMSGACFEIIENIRGFCRLNEARALAAEEESHRISNFSRKISLTCETLMMRTAVEGRGLLAEPRRSGRLRSPAPSPVPSPSSSPVPSPSRNRFRVSRVSEVTSPVSPVASRFRVTIVEPEPDPQPSPIVSDGAKVQIGFDTSPTAAAPTAPVSVPAPAPAAPVRKTSTTTKPQTGMEKLLGLFQNPASLFSSVASVTLSGDKEKNTQSQESNWEWDWGCKDAPPSKSKTNNNL